MLNEYTSNLPRPVVQHGIRVCRNQGSSTYPRTKPKESDCK